MSPSGRFFRPVPGRMPPRPIIHRGWTSQPLGPMRPFGPPIPPLRASPIRPAVTHPKTPLLPLGAAQVGTPPHPPALTSANGQAANVHGQRQEGPAHVVFDLLHCNSFFPRVATSPSSDDDKSTMEALLHRHQEISLPQAHLTFLTTLVSQFTAIIDRLVINPMAFEAAQVIEARPVGAFKSQSLLREQCEAEIVVIMRTLPTLQAVASLAEYCAEQLRCEYANKEENAYAAAGTCLQVVTEPRDYGFDVLLYDVTHGQSASIPSGRLMIYISTTPQNLSVLDPDLHLDCEVQQEALAKVRRSRWMDENANHMSIRVLVRLIKDVCQRFDGMSHLTPWMIDLLAQYAIMNNFEGQPASLHVAYKRIFQLLAAGFFLPGSAGIADPCQQPNRQTGLLPRVHYALTPEQQDELCCTAQTLLRVLSHDGLKCLLGTDNISGMKSKYINVTKEVTVWNGIMVAPSERVVTAMEAEAE